VRKAAEIRGGVARNTAPTRGWPRFSPALA